MHLITPSDGGQGADPPADSDQSRHRKPHLSQRGKRLSGYRHRLAASGSAFLLRMKNGQLPRQ